MMHDEDEQVLKDLMSADFAAQQPEPLIHKHEWFRTGAMAHGAYRCIHCGAWNHEIDAQHSEIEQLKAERDAAVRELKLTTVERNRAYRACEQISVRLHAAEAERDALKTELYIAVGMLSTQPDYSGEHPMDVLQIVKDVAIDAAREENINAGGKS